MEGPLRGTPVWGSLPQIDASRRASSVISRAKSVTWQTTCSNLCPTLWSSCCLRASQCHLGQKKTPPKTLLFPVAVPLLTLPITTCLLSSLTFISSNTPYLAQSRTTVHEWTWESLMWGCFFPPQFFLLPLLLGWTLHCHLQTLLFHCVWPWPGCLSFTKAFAWASTTPPSLFNRSWYSRTFPFCWKPTTFIPIHKPGRTTYAPFLSPLASLSFLSAWFFLAWLFTSNHLSTCQACFRTGRSSLDQILILSQSIWDSFQKKKPPNRTILASVDFSKAFDSVWHSAMFHKLLLLKLPPCFVLWVRSFLSDRRAKVQVGGSCSLFFSIRRGVPRARYLVQSSSSRLLPQTRLKHLLLSNPPSMS